MTLLEAVVALVILGLSAIGFLEAFQSSARSTNSADQWVRAVSYAEATMEQTKLPMTAPLDTLPTGYTRRVDVVPWPNAPGMSRVTVLVTMPDRGEFRLERLVRGQ